MFGQVSPGHFADFLDQREDKERAEFVGVLPEALVDDVELSEVVAKGGF